MVRPGNVAFISQSGALLTAILDWSLREGVGFSAFASIGSMLDVGWGDLIDYLGSDPHTQSIVIYMESIGDAMKIVGRETKSDNPNLSAIRTAAATIDRLAQQSGGWFPPATVNTPSAPERV